MRCLFLLGFGVLVACPLTGAAQARERPGLERLRSFVEAHEAASLEVVRLGPSSDHRALHRRLSRHGRRPTLRLASLARCETIERGSWRGRGVTAAFAGARRACGLLPPRPGAAGLTWYLLRWGTDDDDFKDEAVGFVVVDERRAQAWVIEFHWSWFER